MKIDAEYLTCPNAARLFDVFAENGFQLWYVGGCVRNAILGAPVEDIDLSTNATPDQMRSIAAKAELKVVPTGEAHGTMTFVLDGMPFEITTFRKDVETNGRRAVVAFSKDISEDAIRRDFTMNALYMDRAGHLTDPVGGYEDAVARRIKFINDPNARIKEDFLRILRFFRFYAWYGDSANGIDAPGLAACAENADGLEQISKERVTSELIKICSAPDPSTALASMEHSGVLRVILSGATAKYISLVVDFEEGALVDPLHRLAALTTELSVETLRLPKNDFKRVTKLIELSREMDNPFGLGHLLGLEDGRAAYRIRCALLEQSPDRRDLESVDRGAASKFPLNASHVSDQFSGAALGRALGAAKTHWLQHMGRPTVDELISLVVPDL